MNCTHPYFGNGAVGTTDCCFRNVGVRCSRGKSFGFMCDTHADKIFGLAAEQRILVPLHGAVERVTPVSFTRVNETRGLVPFPYEYDTSRVTLVEASDEILIGNVCFCFKSTGQTEIEQWVYSAGFNQRDSITISNILFGLMCHGAGFYDSAAYPLIHNFTEWCRCNTGLKHRVENMYIYSGLANNKQLYIPLSCFPTFYQALFYFFEMSVLGDPKTDRDYLALSPSLEFSLAFKNFRLLGPSETFFLNTSEATDYKWITLRGIRVSSGMNAFQVPFSRSDAFTNLHNVQAVCVSKDNQC